MPLINDETKVCKDICRWKEYVKVPDICKVPMDWKKAEEDTRRIHEEGKLTMAMMASGLFEQSHACLLYTSLSKGLPKLRQSFLL